MGFNPIQPILIKAFHVFCLCELFQVGNGYIAVKISLANTELCCFTTPFIMHVDVNYSQPGKRIGDWVNCSRDFLASTELRSVTHFMLMLVVIKIKQNDTEWYS